MIAILDFGGQYTRLIARRLRELGVYTEILPPDVSAERLRGLQPGGLVLSGGPASIYDQGAPRADPGILGLGVPVLGICYGMHWLAQQEGG